MLFTRTWTLDTLERAVKTAAQTILAAVGLDAANVLSADWSQVLSLGAGATLISVLSSVISAPAAHRGTASLSSAVEPSPQT